MSNCHPLTFATWDQEGRFLVHTRCISSSLRSLGTGFGPPAIGTSALPPPSYIPCEKWSLHLTWLVNLLLALIVTFLFRGGSHVIPINYVPWSRPAHSFSRDFVFPRATIKALPEAWRQIMTVQGAMSCNVRHVTFT